MGNSKIYLSPPHMGNNELRNIQQAFAANWIAPAGPDITAFEQNIEQYLGNSIYAAALNSGSAALHLALILLNVRRGDEVICQSFTFAASANPIMYLGATPIFVDSEPYSWNICPNSLEDAIKSRLAMGKAPKAIIAVDLYGMPYNANAVNAIALRYGIPVIEDSAEALGSTYNGQRCGTLGDIGILSFNGNKIITTSAGGALLVKNRQYKERALHLATQAKDNYPYYHHTDIGYNYRMSNICAGIGRGQMEVLESHINARREVNTFYREIFDGINGITFQSEPDKKYFSNYWLTAITVDAAVAGTDIHELMKALADDNIESRYLWKPLHTQPVYKEAPYYGNAVCEGLFESGLCVPSGSGLTDDERARIAEAIKKGIGKN